MLAIAAILMFPFSECPLPKPRWTQSALLTADCENSTSAPSRAGFGTPSQIARPFELDACKSIQDEVAKNICYCQVLARAGYALCSTKG